MRKKIIIITIIVLIVIACKCIIIHSGKEKDNNTLPCVNENILIEAIKQSSMPDGGYRFANAEVSNSFSVYATYYIRKAKECVGLSNIPLSFETKEKIIDRFLNDEELDLTDLFCTALLLENEEQLPEINKDIISSYIDSIYREETKCYVLHDCYNMNIYANYSVYKISQVFDIEIKSISNWLSEAIKDYFVVREITEENSSAYVMLLELAQSCNLHIPETYINPVIFMFENSIQNIQSIEKEKSIYIPTYLMDYMDFCSILGIDNSQKYKEIIQILCNQSGVNQSVFWFEYDVLGFYEVMRVLELAGYDFKNCENINGLFNVYDSFMLNNGLYISPCYVESNFVDTYYVDALIHDLNLSVPNNIVEYSKSHKNDILQSGAINIYYYIVLLQRNNLMNIIEPDRDDIVSHLLLTLDISPDDMQYINMYLPTINACLKGLNILGESMDISENYFMQVINNFQKVDNIQQQIYDISYLIEFICLVSSDNVNMLNDYCQQLEDLLVCLSKTNTSNKIILQNKALDVLKKAGYNVTNEVKYVVGESLKQAYEDGLFKGGDSDDDIVNYCNIYSANILLKELD